MILCVLVLMWSICVEHHYSCIFVKSSNEFKHFPCYEFVCLVYSCVLTKSKELQNQRYYKTKGVEI
jgi:hypothetical protein